MLFFQSQVIESDNEEDNLQEHMRDYEDLDADVKIVSDEQQLTRNYEAHILIHESHIIVRVKWYVMTNDMNNYYGEHMVVCTPDLMCMTL